MTDGLFMTQIILKTTVWKEDTEEIADKGASGGIAVSGSAIGRAYVRMIIRTHFQPAMVVFSIFRF
jgi:hypothetical protein